MTKSLEEDMAAALDGQFFWEKTTKHDECNTGFTAEIRRVQRKFAKKAKPPPKYVPTDSKVELVKARLEAISKLPEEVAKVRNAICNLYGLTERELEGEAAKMRLFPARAHYAWCVLRYNPGMSLAEIGRVLSRNHSTILHGRDLFESKKHLYTENIKIMDDLFNFKPG